MTTAAAIPMSSAVASGPTKVMILNQYYAPDVASTGHLLHELATDLAKQGFGVRVLTCRPCYGPPETWVACPLREHKDGVSVRRMWSTRFSKDRMVGRALNIVTFFVPLFFRMLFTSKRDYVYLYTTNPPFLGIIGALVSLLRAHRYVQLLHDSHPQLGVWVGKVKRGSMVERIWHRLNRVMYRRASRTIVLCEAAKSLVAEAYGIPRSKIDVIHNWADPASLTPKPKSESEFAKAHGLVEPFTLMYSGNLGLYYEFETVLEAAERLRDENFRLVLVGSGGRKQWIAEEIERRKLKNTLLLPYQPFEKLSDSLSASDAQLVTIAKGIEGISFPSKLYSALAVARPIIALSEPNSEMRNMVEGAGVGRWFPIGDADALVAGLRQMMADKAGCERMGLGARALLETTYTLPIAARAYGEVLRAADEETR